MQGAVAEVADSELTMGAGDLNVLSADEQKPLETQQPDKRSRSLSTTENSIRRDERNFDAKHPSSTIETEGETRGGNIYLQA